MSKSISPFKKLVNLLFNEKKEILFIYLYGFLSGLVALTLPLGIQAIINLIVSNQVSSSWIVLIVLVIIGIIITSILQLMQLYITENFQQKIFVRAAFEFAYRIPRLKFSTIINRYPPEIVNRFFDILTIQKGLPKILIDFSAAIFQIILGVLLLSFYHPFFIFFGVVLLLIIFVIFRYSFPIGLKTSLQESKYKYQIAHWLEEVSRAIFSFKLSGESTLPEKKIDKMVVKYLKSRKSHFRILIFQYINLILFKIIITAGLLLIGGLLLFDQQMNLGQFVAAEIIILLIINSTEKLILSIETFYDVLTGIEKVDEVTAIELDKEDGVNITPENKGIEIELKHLTLSYWNKEALLLQDLNLQINKGEKILLTGYQSSGKSALLNLLSSVQTDFEGKISYNGISLSNTNLSSLRQNIGTATIYDELFNSSIAKNISFDESCEMDWVQEISEIVGLKDIIANLPLGYETILNTFESSLPKVISFKIKLARCLLKNPRLILIDDDFDLLNQNEKIKILEYLSSLKSTLILISTDKNIVEMFDRIIVLETGKLIAFDKYENIKNENWISKILK